MRQALRPNTQRQPTAQSRSIPAPILGWNARDSVADVDERFALTLDNYYPETNFVRLRSGYSEHASAIGGAVETLLCYESGTTTKLLAAGNGKVFDATTAGAASELVTGKANDRYQYVNFNNFLILVNGADTPQKYEGTTLDNIGDGAEAAITGIGLTVTDLIHVSAFKERLYFVEKDTLNFWYLGSQAIGGTATKFPLEFIAELGGTLTATASWTVDGGAGQNDLFVAITSNGEVIVYSGSNPGSDFSLVGVYRISPPIGRRCIISFGGDLQILTLTGAVSLTTLLNKGKDVPSQNVTFTIDRAYRDVAKVTSGDFGWQPVDYPKGGYALINHPITGGAFNQFIVNTSTGAWCRFTDQNGASWEVCDDTLYFGDTVGRVFKADVGTSDNAEKITGIVRQAFSYFETRGRVKDFKMVRPLFSSNVTIPIAIQIDTDFSNNPVTADPVTVEGSSGAQWDEDFWDVAEWGGSVDIRNEWYGITGQGHNASLKFQTETLSAGIEWSGTDWIFEIGGHV